MVAAQGRPLATEAFGRLQDIFAQYAPDEALVLLPGHAYFLADSDEELAHRLRYELMPLLGECLQEGRHPGTRLACSPTSTEEPVHHPPTWLNYPRENLSRPAKPARPASSGTEKNLATSVPRWSNRPTGPRKRRLS